MATVLTKSRRDRPGASDDSGFALLHGVLLPIRKVDRANMARGVPAVKAGCARVSMFEL